MNKTKQKIFNDPVYGFITIPNMLASEIIEHRYFQRLRRIRQLGLTHLVYPGALHTRFHHALGAMHLMTQAIEVLRSKGVNITQEEAEAVTAAILLHDIGHAPFSHALEHSIVTGVDHEKISELFMQALNNEMNHKLELAIEIFEDRYPKKFLHQLVSSQLDMDRLDYLNRDSFFTGVSEGVISSERIIKMLDVHNDALVVEQKGIYSVEKFITARRLMYWQVYLHKTVISAENLLVNVLRRAKHLAINGQDLFATPALHFFLANQFTFADFSSNKNLLQQYALLDDYDIYASIKVWMQHEDKVLSHLCRCLVDRKLYKITIEKKDFGKALIADLKSRAQSVFNITENDCSYFVFSGTVVNNAYKPNDEQITIYYKNGHTEDISTASDNLNISVLSEPVTKYFLCFDRRLV